jgi:hypothetical protein
MAWTQSDVDGLKSAIAKGVQELRTANGEMVRYQSLSEMRAALAVMEAEVAGTGAARKSFGVTYPTTSRGL